MSTPKFTVRMGIDEEQAAHSLEGGQVVKDAWTARLTES